MTNFAFDPDAAAVHPRQKQDIIEQAKQAWIESNGSGFAALFVPSGELIVPGHCYQGQDQILQAFQDFASISTVSAIEIHNIVSQGTQAFVEWYWEEKSLATGAVSKSEDAIAIDFDGDRIQRWREYIDPKSHTSGC